MGMKRFFNLLKKFYLNIKIRFFIFYLNKLDKKEFRKNQTLPPIYPMG